MHLMARSVWAVLACLDLAASQLFLNTSSTDAVTVKWVGDTPNLNPGTTFGLPWARGKYSSNTTRFTATDTGGQDVQLQTWVTAWWPDNSIKWTGHAVPATADVPEGYTVLASNSASNLSSTVRYRDDGGTGMSKESEQDIVVSTGQVTATFPKSGSVLVSSIVTAGGTTVGQNGYLVLQSQSSFVEDDAGGAQPAQTVFESKINTTTVSEDTSVRTLVTVTGVHSTGSGHVDWLPFTLRFYLYKDSEAIRIVHTILFDGEQQTDFIRGIGIRFDVPLSDELYNRHIKLAGPEDGGFLAESPQGITGLRRDPAAAVRAAQIAGQTTPNISTWATTVSTRMQWLPVWNDYSLTQLSPDGFTIKKRTKAGQTWINIPAGTRSEGLGYLGGSTGGGLAVALRDFWKRYPTSIDIRNAGTDLGQITLWLYSPAGPPMDLRPYHDKMGEDTYAEQLDALELTYEDYEQGFDTPYGVGRTNEVFLFAFEATPSPDVLSNWTAIANLPPVLYGEPEYIRGTNAMGTYWGQVDNSTAGTELIEGRLDFVVQFLKEQIDQRRWYGFWDYGDFMHTYDDDRHQWRYDVGGFAWDNSELSPDLFFWMQFLRTGDADVYRLAEAQLRHTSEVDVYHMGNFSGLGTRHGVLHWGDSAKQIRISTTAYRKTFYYISGGDERVGDIVHGVLDAEQAFYLVDARRKVRDPSVVYVPDPEALFIDLGLDWIGLVGAFLMEWERRGPRWEEAKAKLFNGMASVVALKNGFITGEALYNSSDGAFSPPAADPNNTGVVDVSHLDGAFGLQETILQLADHVGEENMPEGFMDIYLDYCYYYGASKAEQAARYGANFGSLSLFQGYSKYTAYAAYKTGNASLAARAWKEFTTATDGILSTASWETTRIDNTSVLMPVDEATWFTTNTGALYAVAAVQNLFFIGDQLT
jgi:hypothetical protein